MSIMAWYPLPQSGSTNTPSAGDEFFDDQQSAGGWPLWSFGSADSHDHGVPAEEKHANSNSGLGSSGSDDQRQAEVPAPQQCTQPTDEIFMSQFSEEEVRRMDDAPFEALDMFPDSMHQLLSYENMLTGVLTGSESEEQDATLGVDTMDTCGFPLFSHDLQSAPGVRLVPDLSLTPTPKDHQAAAANVNKRSRSVADEGSLFFEALVLQDLEDVVFQLTKRTRVCFRDAFFRLAESSRANKCSAANGTPSSSSQTVAVAQQAEGIASPRISTTAGCCPERQTNAIDRTVADLTMKPPRPVPLEVLVSRCADDDSVPEAQSAATSWTTTA